MSLFKFKTNFSHLLFSILIIMLSGCANVPKEEKQGMLFFPPLPNPPRIQYLTTLTTMDDLKKKKSSFADFILGEQSKESLFKKPYGVAMHDGKIYVVDIRGGGYVVLDLKTGSRDLVSGGVAGRMNKPINISIDVGGTKYISDTGRQQILVFDRNDKFIRAFGVKGQLKPSDVAITTDRLFVADLNSHTIQVLDKNTGKILNQIGSVGSKDGELFFPTNLVIGVDNHLYVSDTGNFRVQKFTLDGKFVQSYGSIGSGFGKFARPKGVAIDKQGRIYVVDAAFENVQLLNNNGKLLLFFGQAGNKPGDMNLPADISIDYKNVGYFQVYAHPKFKLEYIMLVSSQFGVNKISVFGFGRMEGMEYSEAKE